MTGMNDRFFENPILNSPYTYPNRHWELDDGQPTRKIVERRRRAEFISPIPKPRKRGGKAEQERLVFDEGKDLSTREQQYERHAEIINGVRREVDTWRQRPDPHRWRVTPETARLLQHWRHHRFGDLRPFFCQIEAVETVIWLTEVAPDKAERAGRPFLQYLEDTSQEANPGLLRLALKLATGAGKTMVMAMLIAWQTVNAVRRRQSRRFTRGFLIVTPGLTIKDRLRVPKPRPGFPAPGGRDQGLPGRRCEAQEGDHGDLLDTRRESTRYPWALGVRGADRRLHGGRGLCRQREERGPWTHRKDPAGCRDRGREKFGRSGRKDARPQVHSTPEERDMGMIEVCT